MASEARQYAQRNRQGSDWFSHDSNAVKPVSPAEVTEPVAAASEAPAIEDVVDQSPTAEAAAPAAAPPVSARAQMIRPKSDSNEWCAICYFYF